MSVTASPIEVSAETFPWPNKSGLFARCQADSAYPQMWNNVNSMYAPFLGPSGDVLYDYSPYHQHTNEMVGDPQWTIDPLGGWYLAYDASDYHRVRPAASRSSCARFWTSEVLTWICRFRTTSTTVNTRICGSSITFTIAINTNPLTGAYQAGAIRIFNIGATTSKTIGGSHTTNVNNGEWQNAVIWMRPRKRVFFIWINGTIYSPVYSNQTFNPPWNGQGTNNTLWGLACTDAVTTAGAIDIAYMGTWTASAGAVVGNDLQIDPRLMFRHRADSVGISADVIVGGVGTAKRLLTGGRMQTGAGINTGSGI